MTGFLCIISFILGFTLGVFERKVDRLKINRPKTGKSLAEIINTPDQDQLDKESNKEFYDRMV